MVSTVIGNKWSVWSRNKVVTLRVGILTVSDRSARGQRPDASGPALKEKIISLGWLVSEMGLVPDDLAAIQAVLAKWADGFALDVILTTGGTGFAPRDITPEATQAVIERPAPGLVEAMRAASLQITPHAMLSRGAAGIRGRTLIVNLPGSPRAALENLDVILPVLPHAIQLLREDEAAEASH
ncbi:MAG: MogA/MoaB family molybdenum cofactor biosynthesis protein [Anaerolineae bacterium]|nr:MogA/MoaB family molybdenum cofactor biosynthesis protein [Anaerolineae bacterium]MBL6965321.1 MogA/MoaB family molybdenum cofactor biosynthesis protein [Anaerolineales bacterium]